MNNSRFTNHATQAIAATVIAIWLHLPLTLLLLLICPLIMFFVMRGIVNSDSRSRQRPDEDDLDPASRAGHPPAGARRPLDGSHERIDNP